MPECGSIGGEVDRSSVFVSSYLCCGASCEDCCVEALDAFGQFGGPFGEDLLSAALRKLLNLRKLFSLAAPCMDPRIPCPA
eukprot:gene13476-19336_t